MAASPLNEVAMFRLLGLDPAPFGPLFDLPPPDLITQGGEGLFEPVAACNGIDLRPQDLDQFVARMGPSSIKGEVGE